MYMYPLSQLSTTFNQDSNAYALAPYILAHKGDPKSSGKNCFHLGDKKLLFHNIWHW